MVKNTEVSLLSFTKALKTLKIALEQPINEFIRDSVIKRFEYTFDLSWKTLKRYFNLNQGLDESNIKNLIREAGRQNLIDSVEDWFDYHRARHLTSEMYKEDIAEEIYKIAVKFADDASLLLHNLEKKLNADIPPDPAALEPDPKPYAR